MASLSFAAFALLLKEEDLFLDCMGLAEAFPYYHPTTERGMCGI